MHLFQLALGAAPQLLLFFNYQMVCYIVLLFVWFPLFYSVLFVAVYCLNQRQEYLHKRLTYTKVLHEIQCYNKRVHH